MAQLIRISVDVFVEQETGVRATAIDRAKRAVGQFTSGSPDGSRLHDRHLADAFAGK